MRCVRGSTRERNDARRKHEDRSTDVRDPAGKEERSGSASQVLRLKSHGAAVKEFADVIERHNDHRQSA